MITYEGECNWCDEKEEQVRSSPKRALPSDRCMTCDCMYPCSYARADSARALRPHEL